jgi:hypothetical protein
MRVHLLFVLAACSGCVVVPHAAILGQSAAPLARGEVAASASLGVGYQSVSSGNTTNGTLQLPAVEGNLAAGLTDRVGLNLHGSEAGFMPGVKVTLVHGPVDLAIMPELGGAYYYTHQSMNGPVSANTGSNNGDLLLGMRVLFSVSVFYLGAGYHFLSEWSSTTDDQGRQISKTASQYHTLVFNVGLDLEVAMLRLRPEIAFLVTPVGQNTDETTNPQRTTQLGYEWTILPSLTVTVARKPKL